MIRLNKLFYISIFLCSFFSCHKKSNLEQALELAGKNRVEMEKVLDHYSRNPVDSLKLNAAKFLIENMPGKFSVQGKTVDFFYMYIDSIFQIKLPEYNIDKYNQAYKADYRYAPNEMEAVPDIQNISSSYLIDNIDQSFALWTKPWNAHLRFDQFCEYILPYRMENEILEDWRPLYQSRFGKFLEHDSIRTAKQACIAINNVLIDYPIHIALSSIEPASIRPSTLINMKFGLCEDWAQLAVYAMRANGIPVSIDYIPHWGRNQSSHVFNVVYDNDGEYADFSGAENNPNDHLSRFEGISKVYRVMYGVQKSSLASICGKEKIPPQLADPHMLDVTYQYPVIKQHNIEYEMSKKISKRFLYLCVFDINGWYPVAWSEIKNQKKVKFENVGVDIVYQMAFYDHNRIIPYNAPFLLDSTGHISFFIPSALKTNMTLDRKFRFNKGLAAIPPSIIGGRFQASDNLEFRNAITIYTIKAAPEFKYTSVEISIDRPYKNYRYLAPDSSRLNMAEIQFFDELGNQVRGKVIGVDKPSIYFPENTREMVFDGDPLTFFHTQDPGSWVGMAFEKPVLIHTIRYIIRNDDNGIRKGNDYELFYATDSGWKSLGRKIAKTDDEINFDNVPENALFWIRDYTRGKEERPFTYENGQQVWW